MCTYHRRPKERGWLGLFALRRRAPCAADELALLPAPTPLARGLGPERLLFGKPYAAIPAGPGREADEAFLCHE